MFAGGRFAGGRLAAGETEGRGVAGSLFVLADVVFAVPGREFVAFDGCAVAVAIRPSFQTCARLSLLISNSITARPGLADAPGSSICLPLIRRRAEPIKAFAYFRRRASLGSNDTPLPAATVSFTVLPSLTDVSEIASVAARNSTFTVDIEGTLDAGTSELAVEALVVTFAPTPLLEFVFATPAVSRFCK